MDEHNKDGIGKNNVLLRERKHIEITGVQEVSSFDDREVIMNTSGGNLTLEGDNLKIGVLDTDKGIVAVEGKISAVIYYDEPINEKRRFLGKKNK